MIKIVTDSCIDFPRNLSNNARRKLVHPQDVVPLSFEIGGSHYQDGSVTTGQFLKLIKNDWPTTSIPNPESFARVFRKIVSKGDQVLCLTISSGLSATNSSAVLGSEDLPKDVRVIDSKNVSLGIYYLVEYANELIKRSLSLEEVAEKVKQKSNNVKSFILINNMENLKRGGRASLIKYLTASMLDIKPLLQVDSDGKLQLIEKKRGWRKAKETMLKHVISLGSIVRGGVIHIQNLQEAVCLADSLYAATGVEFDISETGPVIATHAGKDSLGIVVELK